MRSQIAKGLASPQLRSGREKNSQRGRTYNHWSEEEDRELISLLWTGARGKDRVLPGRNASSCKKRLQRIHNHLDKKGAVRRVPGRGVLSRVAGEANKCPTPRCRGWLLVFAPRDSVAAPKGGAARTSGGTLAGGTT